MLRNKWILKSEEFKCYVFFTFNARMQSCPDRNLDEGFKRRKKTPKTSEGWNELRDRWHVIGCQQDFKISTFELWKHVKNIPEKNKQKSFRFRQLV